MKKSGAPEEGDLVKIRQGVEHPDYTDWSTYDGTYLVVGERGIDVQLLELVEGEPPMWIRRDHLDIIQPRLTSV
ncbi:MAG TPA: hypothetical protein EYF95_05360 [Flavobacteriales bacterium]|jgi:hypothetical protein|nr:hypothetical protein [Flavobacteriales bacterium]